MSRYNDCLNQIGDQHAWMAFIDADEVCRPQAAGTCMGMLSSPAFSGLRRILLPCPHTMIGLSSTLHVSVVRQDAVWWPAVHHAERQGAQV